ncbi:MAG: hypothetical protein CMH85_02895 [Novosphingobium sp.]|jgi:hypothetical protein|uniref:SnoaL-like domain-containing protein n=1 Tax=Novosphingobium indicum TaxID=462949 RepID=A0ABQ2JRY3_9SPHN|nr:nuclear transport factor 2 family protein [Novosphingobium indicum]MAC57228.1 hypothetical protein [Novosphingobium sp.]GGN52168.1 hypothetical protein GCM10011349_25350 [Novosphingobium indicum]
MSLELQTIADRIAIEECVYRYAHLIDSLQFHRVADEVFAEDGRIEFGATLAVGREAIHAQCMAYRGALLGCSHNVSNLMIEVTGDEARAASRVLAWHWFAIADADPLRPSELLAVGGYEDRLRRTPAGWRIYERRGVNFGTGVGIGQVPEAMRPAFSAMHERAPSWPA